jgi:hypothetical protein
MSIIGGVGAEADKYSSLTGQLTTDVVGNGFNISGVNSLVANTVAGTLTTPSQTNITSLGTMTSDLNMGGKNIVGAGQIASGISPLSADLNFNGFDLTNAQQVRATNLFGTVQTAAQPAVTSIGPLSTTLNMNSNKITNLATPTLGTDAATKAYADSVAAAGNLTGTTLASNVVNSSLQNLGAQNATLNMNANKISNLATPTLGTDAATKAYADSVASGSAAGNLTGTTLASNVVNSSLQNLGAQNATLNMNGNNINSCGILSASQVSSSGGLSLSAASGSQLSLNAPLPVGLGGGVAVNSILRMNNNAIDSASFISTRLLFATDAANASQVSTPILTSTGSISVIPGVGSAALVFGTLDMRNNKIIALGTPTVSTDAATKAYVDGRISDASALTGTTLASNVVNSSLQNISSSGGLTITPGVGAAVVINGGLNMNNNKITALATPTATTDAATKAYVDSTVLAPAAAGTLTGSTLASGVANSTLMNLGIQNENMNLGNKRITNLGIPLLVSDAATKGYVEFASVPAAALSGASLSSGVVNSSLQNLGAQNATLNMNGNNINSCSILSASQVSSSSGLSLSAASGSQLSLNAPLPVGLGGGVAVNSILRMNNNAIDGASLISTGLLSATNTVSALGGMNMGSTKISNLATPTANTDAATKGYVDSSIVATPAAAGTLTGTSLASNVIAASLNSIGASGNNLFIASGFTRFWNTGGPTYIALDGDGFHTRSTLYQRNGVTRWEVGVSQTSAYYTDHNYFIWDNQLGANIILIFGGEYAVASIFRFARLTTNGTLKTFLSNGTVYVDSSDRRLKRNEVLLDTVKSLETVMKLRPKSFYWKECRGGHRDIGFVAQDVEELLPEAVDGKKFEYDFLREGAAPGKEGDVRMDENGNPLLDHDCPRYRSLNTTPILSVLVSACQELEKRNKLLEDRMAILEEMVSEFISEFVPNKRQRV